MIFFRRLRWLKNVVQARVKSQAALKKITTVERAAVEAAYIALEAKLTQEAEERGAAEPAEEEEVQVEENAR